MSSRALRVKYFYTIHMSQVFLQKFAIHQENCKFHRFLLNLVNRLVNDLLQQL